MHNKSNRLDRFFLVSMLILCLILSIVTGCQPQSPLGTFTDDMGREVTMEKVPKRIVSLAPSHTEILFALGVGDRVVGVTQYCNYPDEAQKKGIVGGFATPDIDKIIALKPDLILSFGSLQKSLVGELEAKGQKIFWLYPHTFKEVLDSFERIGELVGASAAAQRLIREVEQEIDRAAAKTEDIPDEERPTVFRVMGLDPPATIGGQAFQTDVYHLAGGINIFADTDKDYFQFGLQTLIDLDPDIIVICGEDDTEARARIKDQDGWGELTAVQKDRIVVISCDLICRPSPRIGQTVQKLATDFEAITSSFIKVTDQMGRVVELERIPEKIISLAPSNTEVVYALGLEDRLVGVTEYCDYPEAVKEKNNRQHHAHLGLELKRRENPDE